MSNVHDKYEELASLAPLGELSETEQAEFLGHLRTCNECRKTYANSCTLIEAAFVVGSSIEEDNVVEDQRYRRARQVIARRLAPAPAHHRFFAQNWGRIVTAAAMIALFVLGLYTSNMVDRLNGHSRMAPAIHSPVIQAPAVAAIDDGLQSRRLKELSELNDELAVALGEKKVLRENLQSVRQELSALTDRVRTLMQENASLVSEGAENRAQLLAANTSLSQAQAMIQTDRATIDFLQSGSISREAEISDLRNSLNREREMLSEGREVRNIMGARDLHIVDVIDRDSKGRPRKVFGRAFYTQGKSLIFYAFDLPVKNTANGKFVYAAWGSNSNNMNKNDVHGLGIFFSDDQTQHRWAMKFDDPKTLEEIDTVFVTLEPAGHPLASPTGKPILEAFFGTPPNHP